MVPEWLHVLSWTSIVVAFACAAWIAKETIRHPQHMAVMNVVWPVTALFGSVLSVWAYRRWGRAATRERMQAAREQGREPPSKRQPFAASVLKGAAHCGSACTLGDIAAETLVILAPGVLAVFGLGSIFEHDVFARWTVDFVFAFVLGIVFQYFAIAPMRHLGFAAGVWAAVKADTLSLAAWQLGMYGFMALAGFGLFEHVFGTELSPRTPEFWFAMQWAMLCGLATSYPVNWWLLRAGWKERM